MLSIYLNHLTLGKAKHEGKNVFIKKPQIYETKIFSSIK